MSAKLVVVLTLCFGNDGSRTHALCPVAKKSRRSHLPSFETSTNRMIKREGSTRINPIQSYAGLSSTITPLSVLGLGRDGNTTSTDTKPAPSSKSNSGVQSTDTTSPELCSVDVRYNRRFPLTYDAASGRYLDATTNATRTNNPSDYSLFRRWSQFLHSAFVPEGVSHSYYRFMRWRIMQRFVNANVHVIGTQSLLMGLRGMQRSGGVGGAVASASGGGAAALGAAAATNWVLKDTLGKIVRMAWASKMGRKFDPDAKRWRFRASLIYALGNGLEVSTYLHPQYFLVLAMLANSCKQMSMLTSSATRNALYNSFRGDEVVPGGGARGNSTSSAVVGGRRDSGGVENIGDITAKGEAQIAVVDLLGIASGIYLSKAVGVSVQNVFAVWIVLQIMEIFCMYHEMQSVVHKTFNFERMYSVLNKLLLDRNDVDEIEGRVMNGVANDTSTGKSSARRKFRFTGPIPTPEQIAAEEKIFLPPDHLARRAIAFGSPGRTALDPEELDMLVNDVFRGEKYFLVVGQDVKNQRGLSARTRQWMRMRRERGGEDDGRTEGMDIDPQEQCHIVLHANANNLDILKSGLALVILRKGLVQKVRDGSGRSSALRSRDCVGVLREARAGADGTFPHLLRGLTERGWRPPLRSMLGRVSARAEWTIRRR